MKLEQWPSKFPDIQEEKLRIFSEIFGAEGMPLGLHWIMFIPTLQNQCDEEQTEWWLFKALKGEILGTYAQTEMGHGE